MLSEAMQYHRNEIEAMEEVNLQCESLRGIPQAIQNEFIYLHEKVNGNINFSICWQHTIIYLMVKG